MNTSINGSNEHKISFFSRIIILTVVLLTIYPIIFVLLTSLKTTNEFYINIWSLPKNVAWGNFPTAWITAHIGEYFVNSTIVVFTSVLFIIVFGAMAGYALARLNVPYSELIMLAFISVTALPSEATILPLYIMMSKLGMVGKYHSLIIPYIGWGLPMTIYIFKGFFKTLPNELLESARVDGYGEVIIFIKITTPLMLPAVATCAIFNFVSFWGELLWATIALSTVSLRTIPLGVISFKAQFGTDWGPMSAAICMVLIPLIILFLFVQKYFIQGITGGAVKG